MAKAEYPSKAQITRTVEAARAAGIDVASIEVRPDGAIVLTDGRTAAAVPKNDFEKYQHLM